MKLNNPAKLFLDQFYPIHYMVGIKIEDTLRGNLLSRHQTCVLWMIRTKGEGGKVMRRKDIEQALTGWYEISSSTVSKTVQSMSRQLGLVKIYEDPLSAREKIVSLTEKGEQLLAQMERNGAALMGWMMETMSKEEVPQGINFLKHVSEIFEKFPGVDEIIKRGQEAQPK
jgi:DNA-binding MarR family transcriptional regulator